MTASIIHVRFGHRTICYCYGEPFTPCNPATLVCDSCREDQAFLDATLEAIGDRLPEHPEGA